MSKLWTFKAPCICWESLFLDHKGCANDKQRDARPLTYSPMTQALARLLSLWSDPHNTLNALSAVLIITLVNEHFSWTIVYSPQPWSLLVRLIHKQKTLTYFLQNILQSLFFSLSDLIKKKSKKRKGWSNSFESHHPVQRDGRAQTAVAKILKPFIGLRVVTSIGFKNEQQKQLDLVLFLFWFLPALPKMQIH